MPHLSAKQRQKGVIKVLLVDDAPDSAAETALLLQGMNGQHNIIHNTVEQLSDALKAINQRYYDLILLDTDLADMPSPSAIRSLRDAFSYAPIIATMKYNDPELAAQWVGEGADDCLYKEEVDEATLNRVVQYAIKRYHTYSKLHRQSRTHHVLNSLLSLSLQELPFTKLLRECLEIILSAPFADRLHQGAIFITDSSGKQLNMVAHSNLDKRIEKLCENVAFGHCHCGKAAECGAIVFSDQIDHHHQNRVEGTMPHGHYNIPIIAKDTTLGVLVIYLLEGHQYSEDEATFLHGVADTLAGIIERAHTKEQLILAYEQNNQLLTSLTSILIGVDNQQRICHWNDHAVAIFDLPIDCVFGKPIAECPIDWDWPQISTNIQGCLAGTNNSNRFEARIKLASGPHRLLSICATPFRNRPGLQDGYLLIADDVTEQKQFESAQQQTQKLQSIGQLAAGIAHEINTPIQYVGDNIKFLHDAFEEISELINAQHEIIEKARNKTISIELIGQLDNIIEDIDLAYLQEEIPKSIAQTLDGVDRVTTIVRAMKEFSHPGAKEKSLTDINRAIESTVTITRNIWKYHAKIKLELDRSLPQIHCVPGPINEVLVNIIVNASHAIIDKVGESGTLGLISIATCCESRWLVIRIKDNGTGIPAVARKHVFEPFFTTKEVGQGTGQGLSLSHKIIVDQHQGELSFETQTGSGTTFIIKLPIEEEMI
jgi:PAS domain S-box-containing protein